jgi:hypothetical protein
MLGKGRGAIKVVPAERTLENRGYRGAKHRRIVSVDVERAASGPEAGGPLVISAFV